MHSFDTFGIASARRRLFGLLCILIQTVFISSGSAQEPVCPATPAELERRCRVSERSLVQRQKEAAQLEAVMTDPEIVLVKVDRLAGESALEYKARARRNTGVRAPVSGRWLRFVDQYYLADTDTALVAMNRNDYWRYIGEALGFGTPEARTAFQEQEALGHRIRISSFLGPQGRIAGIHQDIGQLERFITSCCTPSGEPLPIEDSGKGAAAPARAPGPTP
ncbi:MAG: hypothetical protein ACOWWM_07500 [Desulfobacterales bacterium]